MDPMTMMLLGGAVSGLGNIGGGLLSGLLGGGNEGPDLNEFYRSNVNPYSDPLLSALYGDLLSQLGAPSGQSPMQASPLNQVLAAANQGLFKEEDARDVRGAISIAQSILSAGQGQDPAALWQQIDSTIRNAFGKNGQRVINQLGQAISATGFPTGVELAARTLEFSQSANQLDAQLQALRPTVAQGRQDAIRKIAEMQSGYPSYTQDMIRQHSEVERGRMRDSVNQQAQVGGYNPAAGIAEVERDIGPIARSLALLSGEQGLTNNALAALSASLLEPSRMAATTAQLGLNTALQNASLAAQQASLFANPQTTNVWGDIGTGFASGAGSLGSGLQSLAMMDLFNQQKSTPGTRSSDTSWLPDWLKG